MGFIAAAATAEGACKSGSPRGQTRCRGVGVGVAVTDGGAAGTSEIRDGVLAGLEIGTCTDANPDEGSPVKPVPSLVTLGVDRIGEVVVVGITGDVVGGNDDIDPLGAPTKEGTDGIGNGLEEAFGEVVGGVGNGVRDGIGVAAMGVDRDGAIVPLVPKPKEVMGVNEDEESTDPKGALRRGASCVTMGTAEGKGPKARARRPRIAMGMAAGGALAEWV